ncbi:MAG: PEP/pyruvate-binding domain-containing protein [Bacteroidota bacterium]
MENYQRINEIYKYYLKDTYFDVLMKKRIRNVLLICSKYNAFMLEEDGRIEEQLFNEYVALNLRYPPFFIQANTTQNAFEILENENIDLTIIMLSVGNIDAFELANKIKNDYPQKPIVVLTFFSREILLRLNKEDTRAIDYVFCWLGNADILLAIIKLIEDKMNADHDIKQGVQAILLIEDSIRYYSSYLPNIYKIVFKQSKEFMAEGLNAHQKTMRMRGRPKILLATTYEEGIDLYEKYKNNLLGIISDIRYEKDGKIDDFAGFKFFEKVRETNKYTPFLLQSSDVESEEFAKKHNINFINKFSKTLSIELHDYITKHFAFGDLIFENIDTKQEIARVSDLKTLQEAILKIPDDLLEYHINKNDFSRWLKARALFTLAKIFEPIKAKDYNNINEIRTILFKTVSNFRLYRGRGVIAKFIRTDFDEYLSFSRIGEGSIGGKARGLAFIDLLLKENKLRYKYNDIIITIPRTVVLSTDVFDEFMETNNLYKIGLSDLADEKILKHFINAILPSRIHEDLLSFLSVLKNPVAIRSSSLLEDSSYQPFAGIYSTYMIPKAAEKRLMMEMLTNAIKSVYASVFYKYSKAYMSATSNVIDEEKMGIILQEVCGTVYGKKFYPTISGVARSINFYPINLEKPEDGVVNIAFGLGKIIVDGGISLRFSPKYPKNILQLSNPEMALRDTQKYFHALDLNPDSFKPSIDEGINILKLKIKEAENDNSLKHIASTFDFQNNVIRDGINYPGRKIVSFANVLKYNVFPLTQILQEFLELAQKEMNNPIEIEFAANLNTPKGYPSIFNFLQIRPIVENIKTKSFDLKNIPSEDTIIYSNSALGNGLIEDICDFVYVKPETFKPAENKNIALHIEKINQQFINENKNYVLVGPGRWGSTDPWLGIPVNWAQISAARIIVESGLENYRIDPSQGTHFFQNLTSFRVGYFTINPFINDGYYDIDYLSKFNAFFEDEFIRHIRFDKPLCIKIDGKENKGVIFKVQTS